MTRFALRVKTSEASGPPGAGSQAERDARIPRPKSGIRLLIPRGYRKDPAPVPPTHTTTTEDQ